jgi:hypothetical protein
MQIGLVVNAGSGGSGSFQVGLQRGSTLGGTDSNVQFGTLANNNLIAYDSTLGYWKNVTSSTLGFVTSVTGTSPVVSSGGTTPAISLAASYGDTQNPYASKTANYFLAAPNGSAGVPTFRAVVAADIPTLNQNTTGTASNVTGIVAVANGGSGTATPALVAGTNVTITGSWPNQTINSSNPGGTVTAVSVTSANGFAGTSSGGATPALTLSTTITGVLKGNATAISAATSGTDYSAGTSALATGILKSTTTTGALSIAVAADFPTLNQNTTGSAATLTTGRTIAITGDLAYTSPSFDGSANVTAAGTLATVNTNVGSFTNATLTVNGKGLITAASSGTAPVTSVTGTSPVVSSGGATPAISLATAYGDTLNPYASKTANYVLASPNGSAGVPTFRAIVATDIPTLNQNTTGTASNVTGTVAIANGGTGQTTAISAFNALAPSQTSNSGKYLTTDGTNTSWATVASSSSTNAFAFAWFIR